MKIINQRESLIIAASRNYFVPLTFEILFHVARETISFGEEKAARTRSLGSCLPWNRIRKNNMTTMNPPDNRKSSYSLAWQLHTQEDWFTKDWDNYIFAELLCSDNYGQFVSVPGKSKVTGSCFSVQVTLSRDLALGTHAPLQVNLPWVAFVSNMFSVAEKGKVESS